MSVAAHHPRIVFGTASFGTGTSQAKFHDHDSATPVLDTLRSRNVVDIDTARAYPVGSPGTAEALLGQLCAGSWATLSTKVTSWAPGSHTAEKISESVAASLAALGVEKVDIMYLHSPDRTTPFEETCRAMDAEFRNGKFARFGLSNHTVEEVEQIVAICEREGLVKPSVYQGRYNPIIRNGEEELFATLRKHGMSFYAYSPSAAGLFSGKVSKDSGSVPGSRWDSNTQLGVAYQATYFKPAILDSVQKTSEAAMAAGIDGHAVALRWTVHHSILSHEYGDAVILGASSVAQLKANLDAIDAGPLSEDLVKLVDDIKETVKDEAAQYHL